MRLSLTCFLLLITTMLFSQIGVRIDAGGIGKNVDSYRGYASVNAYKLVSIDRDLPLKLADIRLEFGLKYGGNYHQEYTDEGLTQNVFQDFGSVYTRGLIATGPGSVFMVGPMVEFDILNESFYGGAVGLFRFFNKIQAFIEIHARLERDHIIQGGARAGINIILIGN